MHAGDNAFMSRSQNDWKVVVVPTRRSLEWIFSLPPHLLTVAVVVLFLLSALPVMIVEVCGCCAAV